MSLEKWKKKVLAKPGAREEVEEIKQEMQLAIWLVSIREEAGLTQRELAKKIGVSQPRVAAIEKAQNVTLDVLQKYVEACGGKLSVMATHKGKKTNLIRSAA
jgi:transcriptional regulator with XRE-family HTH domain